MKRFLPIIRGPRATGPPPPPPDSPLLRSPIAILVAPLCDVAIESWRLALRLARLPDQTPGRDAMLRSVQRMREALSEVGLEISDPQGQPFSEGLTVDILAFGDHPGHASGRRTIQETVRPGIRLHGELVMRAQVIVGWEGSNEER